MSFQQQSETMGDLVLLTKYSDVGEIMIYGDDYYDSVGLYAHRKKPLTFDHLKTNLYNYKGYSGQLGNIKFCLDDKQNVFPIELVSYDCYDCYGGGFIIYKIILRNKNTNEEFEIRAQRYPTIVFSDSYDFLVWLRDNPTKNTAD